jgi:hypothetical protein
VAPIVTTIEVDRPATDVFAYATDPTRFHEWQKGVVSGEMKADGDPKVGDHCKTTRKIGGSERASASELVTYEPPRRWRVRGIDGPIRAIVDVTVEPKGEYAASLTISVDFTGHGIGKVLVPLVVRREAAKEMPANLAALKRQVESSIN